jgi:hypothetical protein
MHKLLRSRAEGQSLIVAALAMVVLVALSGLAVDGSRAFEERRRAAGAADAAALAGTNALATARKSGGSGSAIRAAVLASLTSNGVSTAQSLDWEAYYTSATGASLGVVGAGAIPSAPRGVRVELSYQFNTFLMPVLGRDTLPAAGDATAIYGPIAGPPFGGDLLPLTVSLGAALDMKDNPGDIAVFGPDTGAYKGHPGAFGGVNLIPNQKIPNGNGSPSDCTSGPADPSDDAPDNPRYWWCNGTEHDINIGDELYNNPGMVSNSLEDEIERRFDTRRTGLVPIFAPPAIGSGANVRYTIIGFMAIKLEGYDLTGSDKEIRARYVDFFVTAGAINPNPNALDTGVYAINLID